jgi:hypothetical protein
MATLAGIAAFVLVEPQIETGIALDMVPPIMNAWPITMVFMMTEPLLQRAAAEPAHRGAALAVLVLVVSFFGSNLLPLVEGLAAAGQATAVPLLRAHRGGLHRGIQAERCAGAGRGGAGVAPAGGAWRSSGAT